MVIRRLAFRAACVLLGACAGPADAQVTLEPLKLRDEPLRITFVDPCAYAPATAKDEALEDDPIAELNRWFTAGDWPRLQAAATYLLDRAGCEAGRQPIKTDVPAYDYRQNHVFLVWVGPDTFGTFGVRRLLVHQPTTTAFKLNLPGVQRFYEVFASASPAAALKVSFLSTEKPNPILAELPAIAAKIVPAFFGLITDIQGAAPPPPMAAAPEPGPLWLTAFEARLPAKRASIAAKAVAAEPVSIASFHEDADTLAHKISFHPSACARRLAGAEILAIKQAQSQDLCKSTNPLQECLEAHDQLLRGAFSAEQKAGCTVPADLAAMTAVDTAVRAFVTSNQVREVKADVTFANTPLQRISFGLVSAVALVAKVVNPRVKLDSSGALKADPLPRLLTLATVNGGFDPYDASALSPSKAEQFRWFGGAVLTPDFGVAVGVSYMPVRGLSFNTGVAQLFTKSVTAAEIGKEPQSATDPFKLGSAGIVFFGVGYVFK
ncbi:MAG: hypothetical protein A3G25_12410 [Betaproteobacteria bacterium RIFCSPLOWO2_12_FULL_63_13]|nr:MAG: hypothetical protein A3G25_12410 [Betaproteobacteria bacterium RIFCSPLOWO2_12_FULL_63_13]